MAYGKSNSHLALRALCEGAVMVALSQLLGYLKLYEMPQGGSITLIMLPIFVYCFRWGFARGILASFALSVLQLLLDGAYAWSWQSMVGDYILAFTAFGLCGLFKGVRGGLFIGAVVGALGQFVCNYVTGATVWQEYMPETFFGMTMTSPWIYSALYNGPIVLANLAITLIILAAVYKPLGKQLRGEDLALTAA